MPSERSVGLWLILEMRDEPPCATVILWGGNDQHEVVDGDLVQRGVDLKVWTVCWLRLITSYDEAIGHCLLQQLDGH
jgi:hypothetical protein